MTNTRTTNTHLSTLAATAAVALGLVGLAGGAARAERVHHVPPAEAEAHAELELVAAAPASAPTLVAHYRTRGAAAFTALELVRRDDRRWVAVVPAAAVVAPGLEYYLVAGGAPVFASAAAPHHTHVAVAPDVARRLRDARRHASRRSRVHSSFDWTDFGTYKSPGGADIADQYYRLDLDFAYRLWAYPLEEIRVGYTRLLGTTERATSPEDAAAAGARVSGWFGVGLAPIAGLGIDGRVIVLATQESFGVGARGELRLGDRDRTHIAAGAEAIQAVGATGFVRFGWGTVPRVPMSATVEVTNVPASHRPAGVRLYYDIAGELGHGVRLGLRVGYAARSRDINGYTGGATASVDF